MSFGSLYASRQQRTVLVFNPTPTPVAGIRPDSPHDCPHGGYSRLCSVCKPIHCSRDQTWHFDHPTLGHFDSKGAFDRACKAKGLVRVSNDELVTRGDPTKPSPVRIDHKMIEGILREELPKSRNPDLVARKEQEQRQRLATPLSPVGVEYAHATTTP